MSTAMWNHRKEVRPDAKGPATSVYVTLAAESPLPRDDPSTSLHITNLCQSRFPRLSPRKLSRLQEHKAEQPQTSMFNQQ